VLKQEAPLLIARIRRAIRGFMYGYFVELKTEGVGFRFTRYMRAPSLLGLNVNLGHSILYKFPRSVYFRCTKYRLLMYSRRMDLLHNTATNIKKYRPSDPYKGKGIKFASEKLKFKEGKQRQR
jgi:large subunit ribosomal protein L6